MAASQQTPTERDLELLSAYLDGELTDRERNKLERRLNQERALQDELAALRDTVALLHELPQLKAPRNFTLDPAHYSRAIPWWKRLFTLENVLQLSGALGAVASIVLIVLALLVNSGDLAQETRSDDADTAGNVALLPTITPLPTMTMLDEHLEQTAIAYAGEDLIQTTIIAQSTLYAVPPGVEGTPQPEVNSAAGAAAVAGDVSGQPDDGVMMFDESPQAEAFDSAMGDEAQPNTAQSAPAPLTASEAAEAQTFSAAPEGQSEESAAQFMPTPTAAPSATVNEANAPMASGMASPSTPTMIAATPTTLPAISSDTDSGADSAGADSGQAFREASGTEEDDAADAEAELGAPTSQAIAEANAETPAEPVQEQAPMAKAGTEARDSSTTPNDSLLLATAGAIIFILSATLLVLGRKKAHRS